MKILQLSCILVLILSGYAFGQYTEPGPDQKAKQITADMKAELGLTPEQEKKLYKINLSLVEKRNALTSDTTVSSEIKGKNYFALKNLYMAQIDSVLTPQQKEKRKNLAIKLRKSKK